MLTPDQIEALGLRAETIVEPIVDFLISDIARRISKAGQLTSTAAYQAWRLQNLGISQRRLKEELQKRLKVSQRELEKLLTQSAEVGYDFDIRHLPHTQAVPFSDNTTVQQIVAAAVQMAQEDLTNMVQTLGFVGPDGMARELTEAYQQACDFAFTKVATGAQDYNSAIRDATRSLSDRGIVTIDYASGVHTSLEAAVRRNVMGGLGLMQERISRQNHDDLGCDGWEISAHMASAPDHEPFQGRQFSDAAYEKLNASLVRRIGTLNCGHWASPIILGVNAPQYTREELEKFRQDNQKGIDYEGRHYTMYEATQRQRQLERAIRKQKRRILAAEQNPDDPKRLQNARIRYQVLNQEYRRFSNAAGLRLQHERMEMTGFGPKQARAAEKAASMAEKENLVNENSPRPKKNADYAVDWETVQSEEYSNRFNKLSSSERANSAVRTRAKWALNNRDGAKTEELYAIDMRNGSEIARITDQNYQQGVKRTEQFEKAIALAGKTGAEIMLIHNHPAGSPPSIGDLNALLSTPNAQGITVGHNGSIYRYTAPQKKIPQTDFEVAYRKNSVYTDITAYEKALEELSRVYGFTFERL